MAIKGDEEYIEFLKQAEGFSATPYIDKFSEKKLPTIGYGETNFDPKIKEIDEEEGDKMLRARVKTFEEEIGQYVTRKDLSPEQQRAILDMAYNLGVPRMVKNGLFKKINNRQDKAVLDVINRFSYATDPDTGKKIALGGLTKRQKQRKAWWTSKATKENTAFDFDKFEEDLDTTLAKVESPAVASIVEDEPAKDKSVDRFNFDSFEGEFNNLEAKTSPANTNPLAFASEIARDEDALLDENASKLSKKIGITKEEAKVRLGTESYEDAVISNEVKDIDQNFKAISTWASNPDNFALIKADPEMAKNVERASFSFKDDLEIAFKSNKESMSEVFVLDKLALGLMPKEEAIAKLEAINAEKLKAPSFKYQNQLENIGRDVKKVTAKGAKGFRDISEAFSKIADVYDDDISVVIPQLKKAFKGGALTAEATLNVLRSLVNNPEGTGIMLAQNAGSLLASTGAGAVGAGIGALTPVPGGAAIGGYLGSFAGGSTLMFGQYIQQELQDKYTRQDGTVDYRGLIENEAEWSKVRKTAGVYGGVGGALSVFKFSMLGKFAGKAAPKVATAATGEVVKKATTAGVIRTGLGNFIKEGVGQAGGEFLEEGVASLSAQVYREGAKSLTPEVLADIYVNASLEGFMSMPMGGGMGLGAAAINKAWSSIQSKPEVAKASKTVDTVEKATKALRNGDKLTQLRQAIEDSPASKKYKNKTEDMVESVVEAQKTPQPPSDLEVEVEGEITLDSESTNERNYKSILDDKTSVTLDAAQIETIIKLRGEDTLEFINRFGPEVVADYKNAIENKGTFTIPVAKWLMNTEGMSELDAIVRLDGSEYNAMEGEEILNEFEKNPFALFEEDGETPPPVPGDTPPPLPGEVPPPLPGEGDGDLRAPIAPGVEINNPTNIIQADPTGEAGEPILREVKVYDRFRTNNEREVFKKLNSQVKSAVRNLKGITDEEAEIVAELQFRRFRNRANAIGRDIKDLAAENFIRQKTAAEDKEMPRARGFFAPTPGRDISWFIALRKDAKISTVVHELGHAWLYEMGQDWEFIHNIKPDKLTFAQAEYKFAMDELAKRFGLQDLKKISDYSPENKAFESERLRIHESFAQTTERYFLDGKFEDSRIRRVLETFRKFFTAIADDVAKAYPQFPPLAISPKVERVFSALLGVSKKEAEMLYPMFSTPAFDPGILGAKSKEYLDSLKEAQDSAVVAFYSKAYRRTLREQEELIDTFLDQAYDQATEQVDSMASMQVRKDFIDSGLKISFESFTDVAFNGDVEAASLAKSKMENIFVSGKKKGGESMTSIMSFYQIGDPRVLIDLMLEASRRDDLINKAANAIVDKTAPLLKSDKDLHDVAVEAIQNEPKAKFLRKEMKFMLNKAQSQLKGLVGRIALPASDIARRMEPGAIEAAANDVIKNTRLNALRDSTLINKSDRYGKSAAQKFTKGDFIGAFEDKAQQAVYFQAYRNSKRTTKMIGKTVSLMKRVMKTSNLTLAKTYDMELIGYARQVIAMYQRGRKDFPILDTSTFRNSQVILPSSVDLINNELSRFVRIMSGKTTKDTTVEAFGALSSALTVAVTTARHARSVELGLRSNLASEIGADVVASLGEGSPKDRKTPLNLYWKSILTPRAVLASMFKSDVEFTRSPLSVIYDKVASASANFSLKFNTEKQNIVKALKKIARKEKGLARVLNPVIREIPFGSLPNYGNEPINSPELGVTFDDMSQVMMLMLYMGSESGKDKALRGGYKDIPLGQYDFVIGKVDDTKVMTFIERLISEGKITKDHMDALETIWGAFAGHHEQAKNNYRYVYGAEMGTIQPLPFVTSLGTFSGGYVRLEADGSNTDAKNGNPFKVDAEGKYVPAFYPAQDTGMGETRGTEIYELNFDLGRITSTLQNHMKMAYLMKDMYDVSKIMGRPEVMKALDSRIPNVVKDMIIPWFNRAMGQQYSTESGSISNIVARKIRTNSYVKLFLGNLKTVLKQPLGLFPAAAALGSRNIAKHLFTSLPNFSENKAEIEALSVRMRNRFKENSVNLMKSYEELDRNTGWVVTGREMSAKYSFMFIQAAQNLVDVPVWKAGYEKAVKAGLTGDAAVRFADDAVERTQSSTDIATTAQISSETDLMKIFTMIQSIPIAMFNEMYTSFAQNQDASTLRRAKVWMTMALMGTILPSLLSSMLDEADYDAPDEKDEDEGDKSNERVALNVASDLVNTLAPIVGSFGMSLAFKGEVRVGPIQRFMSDAEKTRKAIGHIGNDVTLNASEVSAMMNFFTSITGLGASVIAKYVKWDIRGATLDVPFLVNETSAEEKTRKKLRRKELEAAKDPSERRSRRVRRRGR
jgi:GH24 family phage-related lysozyme (muramidase)